LIFSALPIASPGGKKNPPPTSISGGFFAKVFFILPINARTLCRLIAPRRFARRLHQATVLTVSNGAQ